MSTHTPGPWRIVADDNGVEFDIVTGNGPPWPWYIATTHDMEGASEANARLIAAAPDLLTALKEYVASEERMGNISATLDRAIAAIAKAERSE